MSSTRARRVADQIRAILSGLILTEMADPRLSHVIITRVEVTRDLRLAHTFFSLYSGGPRERQQAAGALEGAKSHLRRELGARLGTRYVPDLRFHEDRSVEHALHIDEVLRDLSRTPPQEEEPS